MLLQIIHVCGCAGCLCADVPGMPSSVAPQSGEYQRQAAMMQHMWQHQNQLFPPVQQPPVDIALPRMMRQTVPDLEPLPPPGALHNQSRDWVSEIKENVKLSYLEEIFLHAAGPLDRKAAEDALRQARKTAEAALSRAARLAAAAGLDYSIPPGYQVDLSGVVKVCLFLQLKLGYLASHPWNLSQVRLSWHVQVLWRV